MKHFSNIALLGVLLAASAQAQNLQITSLANNGRLTWTNSFPNGSYSVEWASTVNGNAAWQQDWLSLKNLAPTSSVTTVSVPMFYRVRCLTNGLFWPMPLGRTLTFSVSNSVGSIWTQQMQSIGVLSVPSLTNEYTFALVSDPSGTNGFFIRSTDRALYMSPNSSNEQLKWTNGPVGTSWTYQDSSGNIVSTILSTTATVSVPAGTYNNCLVFSNRCAACSDSTPYFIEYVKPGVGLVYWQDYWGVSSPPNIYRLQSIAGN